MVDMRENLLAFSFLVTATAGKVSIFLLKLGTRLHMSSKVILPRSIISTSTSIRWIVAMRALIVAIEVLPE